MKTMLRRPEFGKFLTVLVPALLILAVLPTLAGRRKADSHQRVAPILREEVFSGSFNSAYDAPIPLIVKVKEQLFRKDLEHRQALGRDGSNMLRSINSYSVRLTREQLRSLLRSDLIEYVTLDAAIRPTDTGESDYMPLQDYQTILGLDQAPWGSDSPVTVAVIDSGVAQHNDLKHTLVSTSIDFVGGGIRQINDRDYKDYKHDSFGHGTPVAGIIESMREDPNGGEAGKAEILNIRVIGDEGWGQTSDLIRAIDWLVENHDQYGVRVANMSLGHPAFQSYRDDPLCQAVRRLVDAGVVTVVSAGNLGRLEEYPQVWGGIISPGIEPSAITVGAVNTKGTLTQRDDIATTYSSRGPTLDGIFKPDLVAPGNSIIAPISQLSYLEQNYPELVYNQDYIRMSGTSMATAFVSAVAARILEQNNDLSPDEIKLILLLTATKLDSPHILEQGNGLVNAKTAIELAREIDVEQRKLRTEIRPFWYLSLDGKKCKEASSTCETVWAGGSIAYSDRIVQSPLVQYDPTNQFWGDGLIWSEGLFWTEALPWADAFFLPNSKIWDRTQSSGLFWTDSLIWSEGLVWLDGLFWTHGLFWTDGMIWSERMLRSANTAIEGTPIMGDD